VYGGGDCERWIGDWLAERDRERYTIASKVYWQIRDGDPNSRGTNRKNVRHRVDALLDRLDTDYLDVLYIHRWDDETPARELMKTLNGLVESGKVHYLGARRRPPERLEGRPRQRDRPQRRLGAVQRAPAAIQSRRPRDRRGVLGVRAPAKSGRFPVEPARSGFLTGKYDRDEDLPEESKAAESSRFQEAYLTAENFDLHDELDAVAEEVDATPAQTALAWLAHRDGVTAPIVGVGAHDRPARGESRGRFDRSVRRAGRPPDCRKVRPVRRAVGRALTPLPP